MGRLAPVFQMPAQTKLDRRYAPGAYCTNGTHLYEVLEVDDTAVLLENCATGFALRLAHSSLPGTYRIVKDAPAAPDYINEES